MTLHILVKPNGKEVTVNDNSLSHALSLGWLKKDNQEKKATAKKKAPKAKRSG